MTHSSATDGAVSMAAAVACYAARAHHSYSSRCLFCGLCSYSRFPMGVELLLQLMLLRVALLPLLMRGFLSVVSAAVAHTRLFLVLMFFALIAFAADPILIVQLPFQRGAPFVASRLLATEIFASWPFGQPQGRSKDGELEKTKDQIGRTRKYVHEVNNTVRLCVTAQVSLDRASLVAAGGSICPFCRHSKVKNMNLFAVAKLERRTTVAAANSYQRCFGEWCWSLP